MKNKSKVKVFLIYSSLLVFGIYLGTFFYSWHYDDICLDLGGGRNPGDYPICVIEKTTDKYIHQNGDEFVCDDRGNIFLNYQEAKRFYKDDANFGATFCRDFIKK